MNDNGSNEKSGFGTMSSAIEAADNYIAWILGVFRPHIGASLLEIGTGMGNFRRHIASVERYVSVDISPEVVAKARMGDPGGAYITADVAGDDFADRLGGERFDSVLCVNVLEHVEAQQQALANMLDALKPGGFLLLFVPAFQALFMDMDQLAGHHRRYSRRDVSGLLGGMGCEIARLEYFNPVGGLGWWANRFARHGDLDSAAINNQIRLFDRFIIPVSKALNPLTRGFFGQSVICVAKKL